MKKLAEQAAHDVGVFMNQSNEHGIKGIYILTQTPTGIRFYAQVSRIADILARRGHPGTKNEPMVAAIDVLANPLHAVRMIAEDTEPTLVDPDPDDDSLFPKPTSHDDADSETAEQAGPQPRAHDSASEPPPADPDAEEPPPPDPQDDGSTNRFPRVDQHRRLAELAIAAIGQIDPAKFRPDATLYVHIAQETLQSGLGITRVQDIGPIISSLVADWLGHCTITLKPVIDLAVDKTHCDAYEIPPGHAGTDVPQIPDQQIPVLRNRRTPSRSRSHHPLRRRTTGTDPRGQPRPRRPARAQCDHPRPLATPTTRARTFLFRAPEGRVFLVDQTGSHDLGRGQFAQHIWHAATPTPNAA